MDSEARLAHSVVIIIWHKTASQKFEGNLCFT